MLLLWQRGCLLTRFKNNFDFKVRTLDDCQKGRMHSIVAKHPYVLVFKTTNWCTEECPHCCELSGPNNPKTFIPESVIKGYIKQADEDKRFSRSVVFTGGEITAAYKFVDCHYVPNIINYALNKGCGVDIKTNAGWVNSELATQIYDDITNIVNKQFSKKQSKSQFKSEIPFQVSLSLDRFHPNSMERDFKFIEHFAKNSKLKTFLNVYISSFDMDTGMFDELFARLKTSGVDVKQGFILDTDTDIATPIHYINDNVIVQCGCGELFAGGRAKKMKKAYHEPAPQFSFLCPDLDCLMAFDTNGMVSLGPNNGQN